MSTTKQSYKTTQAQASQLVLVQEGKVKLPVSSVSAPFNKESAQKGVKGYRHSILINFRAVDPRNLDRIKDAFEGGELDDADLSGMTFTHEILVTDSNPNPAIPCKGDIIEANIAFAKKDGDYVLDSASNRIMNITSYQVPVAKELKTLNLFGKAEEVKEGIPNEATEPATSEVPVDGAF